MRRRARPSPRVTARGLGGVVFASDFSATWPCRNHLVEKKIVHVSDVHQDVTVRHAWQGCGRHIERME